MSDEPSVPQSPTRRKTGWLIFALLALIPLGFTAFLLLFDISPPDDADMALTRKPSKDASNPLVPFFDTLAQHPIEPSAVDRKVAPTARPDYQKNRETAFVAFATLMRTEPTTWSWPTDFTLLSNGSTRSELQSIMPLTNLLRVEAQAEALKFPVQGVQSTMTIARFGSGLMEAGGGLLNELVAGIALRTATLQLEAPLVTHPFSSAELATLQKDLQLLEPSRIGYAECLRGEYHMLRDNLLRTKVRSVSEIEFSGPPQKGYPEPLKSALSKPNLTLAIGLAHTRALLAGLDQSWKDLLDAHARYKTEFEKSLQPSIRFWVNPNTTGLAMSKSRLDSFDTSLDRAVTRVAIHRQVILQLALRRFELEHQKLPTNLDELVPTQLESVPLDPYTNQPMKWNATTQTLYCIGSDGIDGGGHFDTPASGSQPDPGMPYWWGKSGAEWREARQRKASDNIIQRR